MEMIPLKCVPCGKIVEVAELTGDYSQTQRLCELGLTTGCRFQVLQQGSPCIIRLSGSKLCFRDNEATSLMVRVPEPQPAQA